MINVNVVWFVFFLHVFVVIALSFYLYKMIDLCAISDEKKEKNLIRVTAFVFIVFVFFCSFILSLKENGVEPNELIEFLFNEKQKKTFDFMTTAEVFVISLLVGLIIAVIFNILED